MSLILKVAVLGAVVAQGAHAQVCGPDDSVKKQTTATMALIYQPEDKIGSCATTGFKGVTNWRDSLDKDVGAYLKQNHADEIAPILDQNHMLNPDVVNARTEAYEKASTDYNKIIASYPDKKGMKSSDYTDIDHVLGAKDISKKERNKAYNDLTNLIEVMKGEEGKWGDSYVDQTVAKTSDESLKNRIIEQAKKKFCVSGVKFDLIPAAGMTTELFAKNGSDKALQSVAEKIQKAESDPNRVWFCSKPVAMQSALHEVSGLVAFDLPKDSFFADNQTTLSTEKIKAMKDKLKEQLRSPPGCVRTVKSVQIETSANAKANAASIGRWDFASLSKKRANYLKDQVGEMFAEEKSNSNFVRMANFSDIVRVNSAGSNGDGTSGPCPYKTTLLQNGITQIDPDPSVWTSPEMEKAKYARISFEIVDQGVTCNHGPDYQSLKTQAYAASQCFTVAISCR